MTAHFHGSRKANYCWKCEKNPKISAPKLTNDAKNNFAKACNPETIHRVLQKAGYYGRNMRRKPFVSKVNRKNRIDFAKENEKQDRNFWNSVIYSDENKFNIYGSMDTKKFGGNKCSSRTKEHDKNCKTWGWFDYGLGLHGSNWSRKFSYNRRNNESI
ncbi:HTH_Tnp_Tc3_2 domain-containing protein [Trichonephila clavipes]|nr:HTH_Tnp_Tc3_2 domain-containing protein [Trichonephila clavipes]